MLLNGNITTQPEFLKASTEVTKADLSILLDFTEFDNHLPGHVCYEELPSDTGLRLVCKSHQGMYEVLIGNDWRFSFLKVGNLFADYAPIENQHEVNQIITSLGY